MIFNLMKWTILLHWYPKVWQQQWWWWWECWCIKWCPAISKMWWWAFNYPHLCFVIQYHNSKFGANDVWPKYYFSFLAFSYRWEQTLKHFWLYFVGDRHSSVVLSASTLMSPRVQIPSTPSMLFQFVLLKLYSEKDENKQKRDRDWPIFKTFGPFTTPANAVSKA